MRKREYSGNSLERSLEHNNLEGPELLDWTSLIGNGETLFIFKLLKKKVKRYFVKIYLIGIFRIKIRILREKKILKAVMKDFSYPKYCKMKN